MGYTLSFITKIVVLCTPLLLSENSAFAALDKTTSSASFNKPTPPHTLSHSHMGLHCIQCHDSQIKRRLFCARCHELPGPSQSKDNCRRCHQKISQTNAEHQKIPEKGCLDCHKAHYHPTHYGPHCSHCHEMDSWEGVEQATTAEKCITCHQEVVPRNHYLSDRCGFCHQHDSWQESSFEHQNFLLCEVCHPRPKRHRTGKCYFCHDTVDWGNAS